MQAKHPLNEQELQESVTRLGKIWAERGWPFKDEVQVPIGYELLKDANRKPSPSKAPPVPCGTSVVQTFWTLPYGDICFSGSMQWPSRLAGLCSLILSAKNLRACYPAERLVLHTDREGLRLFSRLGIAEIYDSVETRQLDLLNQFFRHYDGVERAKSWWVAGKLASMRDTLLTGRSLLHVDLDCFLFSPIPSTDQSSAMVAQSREPLWDDSLQALFYQECLLEYLRKATIIPSAVSSARQLLQATRSFNFGVLYVPARHSEATLLAMHDAFLAVTASGNLALEISHFCRNMLMEQFMVSAIAELNSIPFTAFLPPEPYQSATAVGLGYCHAVAGAKANPEVGKCVSDVVAAQYPAEFRAAKLV